MEKYKDSDVELMSILLKLQEQTSPIRSEVSDSGLAVGTNDIRAATHQFGDERTIRAKGRP